MADGFTPLDFTPEVEAATASLWPKVMGRVTPLALRGGVAARGPGFETVVRSCVLMCDDLPEAASAWASGEIEDARVDTFGKSLSLGTASVLRILKHLHW